MPVDALSFREPTSYEVRIYDNRRQTLLATLTAPGGVITDAQGAIDTPYDKGPYARGSFSKLEYVLNENAVGALTLEMPPVVPWEWFRRDTQIEVWRAPDRRQLGMQLETATLWLVDYAALDVGANDLVRITASDAMTILDRRIVAYYAGSPQSQKNDQYDDMMKAIVRENFGSLATITSRDINGGTAFGLGAPFNVIADYGQMQSGTKAFAWRNALTVLQEIADASAQTGLIDDYLGFRLAFDPGGGRLSFHTFKKSLGSDRRVSGNNPLILSPDMGSLTDVTLANDWRGTKSVVWVAGPGEGSARLVSYRVDNATYNDGPFSWNEAFVDARNVGDTAGIADLDNEALAELRLLRPRRTFTAKVSETDQVRYGIDYALGTLVTAQAKGVSFDCRVKQVHVVVDAAGEHIESAIEGSQELYA